MWLALAVPARPAGAAANAGAQSTDDVATLIAQLADPDVAVRQRAGSRLVEIGSAARPQVLAAARSDDPEQRAQAAEVLRQLPWATPDDPPEVRAALERYSRGSDSIRQAVMRQLDELDAVPTMLRLLREEPSDALRWVIVAFLGDPVVQGDRIIFPSGTPRHARLLALVKVPPAPQAGSRDAEADPQTLLLAGAIWIERDRDRALGYLRRAIEADAEHPSSDGGLIRYAYDQLVAVAIERGEFDEAAALLRRQVPRDAALRRRSRRSTESSTPSLARLLALHEYFGPLDRYAWDRQTWPVEEEEADPASPRRVVVDRVTDLFAQLGSAPPLPLGATAALDVGDRYTAAAFLQRLDLHDAAEVELLGALARKKPQQDLWDANILLLLATIAQGRDDDRAAVGYLQRGLTIKDRNEFQLTGRGGDDDLRAELAWRRARLAEAGGDRAAADREVKNLLQFTPANGNSDSVINMITWLKSTGRPAEAKTLFGRVYDQAKARLDQAGPKSKATPRNDLAWLCARSGERLNEAKELVDAAVAEMPDNAAFLDTQAEGYYRLGRRDEAIKLETRALELSPNQKFMKEQVERFKAGKP
jgi:tetratricopeptide (TPR) repeat protein